MTIVELEQKLEEHTSELLDWAEGRRTWTNLGPGEPYTPDVIVRMDASEVEKHAHAITGIAAALEADRVIRQRAAEEASQWGH